MYITIPLKEEYYSNIIHPVHTFNRYELSNYGDLRIRKSRKLMKPFFDKDGYVKYSLISDSNTRITISGHRLVAFTFLGIESDKVIMHLDGERTNNYEDNLKWGTQKENIEHDIRHGYFDKDRLKTHVTRIYSEDIVNTISEMILKNMKTKSILNNLNIPYGSRDRKIYTSLIHDIKNRRSHNREKRSTTIPWC
jgi:hypothetical protein